MRKHAFLKENIVVKVESIEEDQYEELIREYQNIIDVEDLVITPSVGYMLSGSTLVPPAGQVVSLKDIIMGKIKQYREAAPELLTELYAENTLAGLTVAQSDALFSEYGDVIFRLKEGAYPSALYRLAQKTPSGFVTQEMIDRWHDKIVARMI